jgi:hypothetical protein
LRPLRQLNRDLKDIAAPDPRSPPAIPERRLTPTFGNVLWVAVKLYAAQIGRRNGAPSALEIGLDALSPD